MPTRTPYIALLLDLALTSCIPGQTDKSSHSSTIDDTNGEGHSGSPGDTDSGSQDTTTPTVTILAPLSGETVSGLYSLLADATDDVGVVQVSFQVDGDEVGTATVAPYAASWDTSAWLNGDYELSATALDAASNSATDTVAIHVDNGGLSDDAVRIINPVDGATICGDVSVQVAASADVVSVTFSLDGVEKATDDSAPFTWDWDTTAASSGAHTLRATAENADGDEAQDTIEVVVDNAGGACDNLPSIVFTAPDSGSYSAGGDIDLTATASDDVGVTKVQFFVDGGMIAEDTTTPYAAAWSSDSFDEGPHTLKALAYDTSDQTGSDEISVTLDRTSPVVELTEPADLSYAYGTVTIGGEVTEAYGLAGVTLSIEGDVVATFSSCPCSYDWDTTSEIKDTYTIELEATDLTGNVGLDSISARVDNPPTVTVVYPADGSTVTGDYGVSLRADASDDGGISKVTFYADGTKVGSTSTRASDGYYHVEWDTCDGVSEGSHTVEVKAEDSVGWTATATSTFTLLDPTATCDTGDTGP